MGRRWSRGDAIERTVDRGILNRYGELHLYPDQAEEWMAVLARQFSANGIAILKSKYLQLAACQRRLR